MLGILFSLLRAFLMPLYIYFQKRLLSQSDTDPLVVTAAVFAVSIIILSPLFYFFAPQTLPSSFWIAVLLSGILNTIAWSLANYSMKTTDMSLYALMESFMPALTLLYAIPILGELPPMQGIFGIVLIIVGVYLIKAATTTNPLKNFKLLITDPGIRLRFASVAVIAICPSLDKIGINATSPLFYVASLFSSISIMSALSVLISKKSSGITTLSTHKSMVLFASLSLALSSIFVMLAFSLLYVAYVVALAQIGILLSILIGKKAFAEQETGQRTLAALVLISGALLIVFA